MLLRLIPPWVLALVPVPSLALLGVARATWRLIPSVAVGANVTHYFGDSSRYGVDVKVESRWGVLRGEYLGQHRDAGGGDDPGTTRGLGLAQVQVLF
jgi:hypothetical protein